MCVLTCNLRVDFFTGRGFIWCHHVVGQIHGERRRYHGLQPSWSSEVSAQYGHSPQRHQTREPAGRHAAHALFFFFLFFPRNPSDLWASTQYSILGVWVSRWHQVAETWRLWPGHSSAGAVVYRVWHSYICGSRNHCWVGVSFGWMGITVESAQYYNTDVVSDMLCLHRHSRKSDLL